jgi:hypothetical protein
MKKVLLSVLLTVALFFSAPKNESQAGVALVNWGASQVYYSWFPIWGLVNVTVGAGMIFAGLYMAPSTTSYSIITLNEDGSLLDQFDFKNLDESEVIAFQDLIAVSDEQAVIDLAQSL